MSTQDLADAFKVSCQTTEAWELGQMPERAALNVIAALVRRQYSIPEARSSRESPSLELCGMLLSIRLDELLPTQ